MTSKSSGNFMGGVFYASAVCTGMSARGFTWSIVFAALQHRAMISLAPYKGVLASRELRYLFAASVIGRLPIGMSGLAILLLVQGATRSFATGGAATACYVAGLACVAPAIGRVIDRHGPRAMLISGALLFPASLAALLAPGSFL